MGSVKLPDVFCVGLMETTLDFVRTRQQRGGYKLQHCLHIQLTEITLLDLSIIWNSILSLQ